MKVRVQKPRHRIDYMKAFARGRSVLDHAPRSKATDEIRRLAAELRFGEFDSLALLDDLKTSIEGYCEERERHRRDHEHRPQFVVTDFAVGGKTYKGYIANSSRSGAFVETPQRFAPFQDITLSFQYPPTVKPIRIAGEIVRTTHGGIGVRFEKLLRV